MMTESNLFLKSILPKSIPYKIENIDNKVEGLVGDENEVQSLSFSATVRLKLETAEEIGKWKEEFERLSHSNWIVYQTFP